MGELQTATPAMRFIGFCRSEECTTVYQSEVHKRVPAYFIDCPDCGHALVWRRFNPNRDSYPEPLDYNGKEFVCSACEGVFKTYLECKRHQCGTDR